MCCIVLNNVKFIIFAVFDERVSHCMSPLTSIGYIIKYGFSTFIFAVLFPQKLETYVLWSFSLYEISSQRQHFHFRSEFCCQSGFETLKPSSSAFGVRPE